MNFFTKYTKYFTGALPIHIYLLVKKFYCTLVIFWLNIHFYMSEFNVINTPVIVLKVLKGLYD